MARPRTNHRRHASMYDFRDLDLMLKIEDEASGDPEGWLETEELARALGFDDDKFPIAQRLSWMRRYGMIEIRQNQPAHKPKQWRLSEGGLRVVKARVKAAQTRQLEALPEEAMIDVMANVTSRYHHASPMTAAMLRREFAYGTQPGR
jgi:hypothetical protein